MKRVVNHIDIPDQWKSGNDWFSHRPLLYLMAARPEVNLIVEAGVGDGSTPMLRSLNKRLISFDTDKEWAAKYEGTIVTPNENLITILQEMGVEIRKGCIDVLFVDGKPGEERKDIIERFKKLAKVIVAHDTQESANYVYSMKEVLSSFKYRVDYAPERSPHSTAVSNIIDITKCLNQD